MSDQLFLGAIIGPMYVVLGLSLLIYVKVWQKIASQIAENHYNVLGIMSLNIIFGLAIINTYNVWDLTPWVIITITGWGAFLKGAFYFLLPGSTFKNLIKSVNNANLFAVSGLVVALLGAWLSYLVYLA